MVKRLISVLLILSFSLGLSLPAMAEEAEEASEIVFADVEEGYYAYDAIMDLAERGILNGKSDTHFAPEDSLKREELAKILTKTFSLSEKSSGVIFNDVPAGTWYANYVITVAVSGLVKGVSENTFGVGQLVTRQDLAVILKRFLENEKVVFTPESSTVFADNNEISNYARDAVFTLTSSGVFSAKENNLFRPRDYVTRADMALAIVNAEKAKMKYFDSLGRYGPESQYLPPWDVTTDDRLAQAKPTLFDPETSPQQKLIFEDFNDTDYNGGIPSGTANYNADGGIDGTKCLKVTDGKLPYMRFDMEPQEVAMGDFIMIRGKLKCENLSGTGGFTIMVTIHDQDGKWVGEGYGSFVKTVGEWTEVSAIRQVTEIANALEKPSSYRISIGMYIASTLKGEFYGDDFEVNVVRFPPIDTVLMAPAYKGIIKGEGGIGDIALRTYVDDGNKYWDLEDMRLVTQVTDDDNNVLLESVTDNVTKTMDVYFSSATLPMGKDFYLDSTLYRKSTGEKIQFTQWLLHKREKDFTTVVDFDKYGRILHNGTPKIFKSMYSYGMDVTWDGFKRNDGINVWNGMNYVLDTKEIQEGIERFDEAGISGILGLGHLFMSGLSADSKKRVKNQDELRAYITKLVKNHRDNPSQVGYYLYDEQSGVLYGEELNWTRKIIESVDLDHPTFCAIDNAMTLRPGVYAKTSDFLGYDPYPITGKENQKIELVSNSITDAKKVNPGRPVYIILQGFHYKDRGDLRPPTQEEYRNMTFQALIAGACMIDSFAWSNMYMYMDREKFDLYGIFDSYVEVYREVEQLEPILLSIEPAPHYEVKGGGDWLKHMTKRYNGKSYLFTVSTATDFKTARIHLDRADTIKGMYSGKTYKADKNGWFEIDWEAYQTEVFEYEQAEYKSSHAEIKRFGLVGPTMLDSEGDAYYILDKDTTKAQYVAEISDFSALYINDEKVETTGEIDLSGKTEIKVKVVSEDGRFTTEKVIKLKEEG